MNNKTLIIIGVSVSIFLCVFAIYRKPKQENSFVLACEMQNGAKNKLYIYEIQESGEELIDSLRLNKKGKGKIKIAYPQNSLILVKAPNHYRNFVCLLPFIGEEIKLHANYDSLVETYTLHSSLKDSSPSLIILDLQKTLRQNLYFVDSLSQVWQSYLSYGKWEKRRELDSLYRLVFDKQKQMQKKLCEENPHSLVPIYAMNQVFSDEAVFTNSDSSDFAFLCFWADSLYKIQAGNPHIDRFKARMDRLRSLQMQKELEAAIAKEKRKHGEN